MSNLAGRIALQFCQRFLVLQLGGLIFFKRVICNKQYVIKRVICNKLAFNTISLSRS